PRRSHEGRVWSGVAEDRFGLARLFARDEGEPHPLVEFHRRVHRRKHRVVHRRAGVDENASNGHWRPPPERRGRRRLFTKTRRSRRHTKTSCTTALRRAPSWL